MSCRVLAISVCLLVSLIPSVPLRAQQGADAVTLAGTVLDQAGKAIQGASVAIKNDSSVSTVTIATDSGGRFSATMLPAGTYTIEATAPVSPGTAVRAFGFPRATRKMSRSR